MAAIIRIYHSIYILKTVTVALADRSQRSSAFSTRGYRGESDSEPSRCTVMQSDGRTVWVYYVYDSTVDHEVGLGLVHNNQT